MPFKRKNTVWIVTSRQSLKKRQTLNTASSSLAIFLSHFVSVTGKYEVKKSIVKVGTFIILIIILKKYQDEKCFIENLTCQNFICWQNYFIEDVGTYTIRLLRRGGDDGSGGDDRTGDHDLRSGASRSQVLLGVVFGHRAQLRLAQHLHGEVEEVADGAGQHAGAAVGQESYHRGSHTIVAHVITLDSVVVTEDVACAARTHAAASKQKGHINDIAQDATHGAGRAEKGVQAIEKAIVVSWLTAKHILVIGRTWRGVGKTILSGGLVSLVDGTARAESAKQAILHSGALNAVGIAHQPTKNNRVRHGAAIEAATRAIELGTSLSDSTMRENPTTQNEREWVWIFLESFQPFHMIYLIKQVPQFPKPQTPITKSLFSADIFSFLFVTIDE
jgi:hypothetical protein